MDTGSDKQVTLGLLSSEITLQVFLLSEQFQFPPEIDHRRIYRRFLDFRHFQLVRECKFLSAQECVRRDSGASRPSAPGALKFARRTIRRFQSIRDRGSGCQVRKDDSPMRQKTVKHISSRNVGLVMREAKSGELAKRWMETGRTDETVRALQPRARRRRSPPDLTGRLC